MKERDYLVPWERGNLDTHFTEVLVLGSGIAGLFAAISLCEQYNVTILTKKNIMEGNTEHAQGGIAVALNEDEEDSPEFHYGDTIKAGAGLCNLEAVKILAEKGPACVEKLIALGTEFDRLEDKLDFTREAAHSKSRVIHARGDATGGEIERALVTYVWGSNIEVKENFYVTDFIKNYRGEVAGVLVFNELEAKLEIWLAKAVVLATGGLGQLYTYTTNPLVTTGDGLAAAYRAGAELMDMEFIQFHPTALLLPGAPTFLISEAARGEGAILLNAKGERFMQNVPGQELAPRDIVARAIWEEMKNGPVYLDFSNIGPRVKERFPGIYKTCLEYGIDILTTPVPVGPATHYLMGGVRVNTIGETTLPNLYACGECACNGVHGANRLASNSLLDGVVFASTISDRIKEKIGSLSKPEDIVPYTPVGVCEKKNEQNYEQIKTELKEIMWRKVGIIRNKEGLLQARECIEKHLLQFSPQLDIAGMELCNMLTLGLIVVKSALAREESRGGHFRSDFPKTDEKWRKHSVIRKGDANVRYISI